MKKPADIPPMEKQHIKSSSLVASSQFPEKYKFLREMTVFKSLCQIDGELRAKVPFAGFKRDVHDEFGKVHPDAEFPNEKTLLHLYERGIDAAVDRMWVVKVKEIQRSEEWKTHRDWMRRVIKLAQTLDPILMCGDTKVMPERDLKRAKSISRSLKDLRERFLDIQRFDKRLDEVASVHNWNSSLRAARTRMNQTLHKESPNLSKTHRVELIRLTIERTELNPAESETAVSRLLSPSRQANKAGASRGPRQG